METIQIVVEKYNHQNECIIKNLNIDSIKEYLHNKTNGNVTDYDMYKQGSYIVFEVWGYSTFPFEEIIKQLKTYGADHIIITRVKKEHLYEVLGINTINFLKEELE
jgi:predicted AAA+ superfamily ATPase